MTFRLSHYRFVRDVQVTGTVVWERTQGPVRAVLTVDGPGSRDGVLRLRWNDWDQQAKVSVHGRLGHRTIRLVTGAP